MGKQKIRDTTNLKDRKRQILKLCQRDRRETSQSLYFKFNKQFKIKNKKRYALAKSQFSYMYENMYETCNPCSGLWMEKNKKEEKREVKKEYVSQKIGYVVEKE